ncbi:hypothetical protein B0T24DRAFT_71067 [Lasiosphaeria ovina]|uniref:SPX domain-containing protein n=1 Tax=Lasiosphaeria ovina TaxID=92902 RepID=A0AAE0NM28_9PEZI|nr:hypothetical protein B0T24DRAFT_71067 [Lasiosphaeria ovina]
MKYGEKLEKESVPQWSLHNIDYNSLKHHIKVHTTKDQATAITIPGRQDTELTRFEDELYTELCRQHDRIDLFVTSKADEIARRLLYLSEQIHRLIVRCAVSRRERMSMKRQRLFAKYEQNRLQCGEEIQALRRFVDAQAIAFRKILKKYRKWTGSSALGARFNDTVLTHPKSFTRRNFSDLQSQLDDLLSVLRAASPPDLSGIVSPAPEPETLNSTASDGISPSETIVVSGPQQVQGYWNEYDYGSEAGDADQGSNSNYAIYVDPNDDLKFPGVAALAAFFAVPIQKVNTWMGRPDHHGREIDTEQGPLLGPLAGSLPSTYGGTDGATYFAFPPGNGTDPAGTHSTSTGGGDNEHTAFFGDRRSSQGYASSEEFPTAGYMAHYAALPSISEQSLARYRERVLFWGAWGCFAISFVLMGIAAILILAGRHKLRLEVDAGATLGIVTSLGAASAALGMTWSRQDRLAWPAKLAVWVTFSVVCALNGVLLVLVAGNAPL